MRHISIGCRPLPPSTPDGIRPAALDPAQLIPGIIIARMSQRVEFSKNFRGLERIAGARHIYANRVVCGMYVRVIEFLSRRISLKVVSTFLRDGCARSGVLLRQGQVGSRPPRGVYFAEIGAG